MGGVVSSVFGWFFGKHSKVDILPVDLGPEADIPDPTTSLTPREVAYVTRTWSLVRPDMKSHGTKFFILLFETHPVLQTRFKAFAGKPIEELIGSKRLAAHATTVMTALDSYISNLDDLNVVIEMLETTGINHKKRGVEKLDFELLSPVLVQYLGEALGSAWSKEAEEAWTHLLKVVLSLIFKGFDLVKE